MVICISTRLKSRGFVLPILIFPQLVSCMEQSNVWKTLRDGKKEGRKEGILPFTRP